MKAAILYPPGELPQYADVPRAMNWCSPCAPLPSSISIKAKPGELPVGARPRECACAGFTILLVSAGVAHLAMGEPLGSITEPVPRQRTLAAEASSS